MIIKFFLLKKIREFNIIESISFEEADSRLNSSEISDNFDKSLV